MHFWARSLFHTDTPSYQAREFTPITILPTERCTFYFALGPDASLTTKASVSSPTVHCPPSDPQQGNKKVDFFPRSSSFFFPSLLMLPKVRFHPCHVHDAPRSLMPIPLVSPEIRFPPGLPLVQKQLRFRSPRNSRSFSSRAELCSSAHSPPPTFYSLRRLTQLPNKPGFILCSELTGPDARPSYHGPVVLLGARPLQSQL